jgi:hypothetical protein
MADKKQISQEKQIRITEITLTLPIVTLFVIGIYLGYLKTIGMEISEWLLFIYIILIGIVGFIVSLALNEFLIKIFGGDSRLSGWSFGGY